MTRMADNVEREVQCAVEGVVERNEDRELVDGRHRNVTHNERFVKRGVLRRVRKGACSSDGRRGGALEVRSTRAERDSLRCA